MSGDKKSYILLAIILFRLQIIEAVHKNLYYPVKRKQKVPYIPWSEL